MTLRASLLRELVNPNLSVGGRAELCCELAKEFENRGEYDEAREVLRGLWPRIDQRPRVKGLEPIIAAEVLLRAGVLTGWIGSSDQIADAQEKAKDLISESLAIFESQKYKKKVAEAQTERAIGLCQELGCLNRAAEAALTLYQELWEQLAIKGAITTSGKPLDEEVFLLEHELIKHALEVAQGRVTFAARALGMSYQRLTHKLKTEHKDLLKKRTPVRRRPRK